MKFYKVHLKRGTGRIKSKQYEDTIYVKCSERDGVTGIYSIIRKIPFGSLISAKLITQIDYQRGVDLKSGS